MVVFRYGAILFQFVVLSNQVVVAIYKNTPQGKNITAEQFAAIGDSLSATAWELPNSKEFKPEDLPMPSFLQTPPVHSSSAVGQPAITGLEIQAPAESAQRDVDFITTKNWEDLDAMVLHA